MKNFHTRKTSNGSNFDWLIRQMSINQKSGRQTFRRRFNFCIRLTFTFRFALPVGMLLQKRKIEPDLWLAETTNVLEIFSGATQYAESE